MKYASRVPFGIWVAVIALVLALIPYLFPDAPFLHAGNYASLLLVLLVCAGREIYVRLYGRLKATAHFPETIAVSGGAILLVAALIAALLDPDTQMIAGAPGETVTIAGAAAKAQFGSVQFARLGDAEVRIFPAHGAEVTVTGARKHIFGASLLRLTSIPSAELTATSAQGAPLTITRPVGGGFLAPLLLFRERTAIAGRQLGRDVVAIPALGARALGFLVDADSARSAHFAAMCGGRAGILFDVDFGRPRTPHAIAFAPDGVPVAIGAMRLTARLGVYPQLVVSSLPQPILMLLGIFGLVCGSATLSIRRRSGK